MRDIKSWEVFMLQYKNNLWSQYYYWISRDPIKASIIREEIRMIERLIRKGY
jgi:hypothetical protein